MFYSFVYRLFIDEGSFNLFADPLPEFLNPVQDFNLSVPENGPSVLGILFIQARARSFSNNFARMSFEIISGNKSEFSLNSNWLFGLW